LAAEERPCQLLLVEAVGEVGEDGVDSEVIVSREEEGAAAEEDELALDDGCSSAMVQGGDERTEKQRDGEGKGGQMAFTTRRMASCKSRGR